MSWRRATSPGRRLITMGMLIGLLSMATGCGVATSMSASGSRSSSGVPDPAKSVAANPDYDQSCALSGLDNMPGCLQVALDAIDHARAKEKLGPMRLPATFAAMPFDQQMLTVIDAERVDRHLGPVVGITARLDRLAGEGAAADDIPPDPGSPYAATQLDAFAGFSNALDVDYQWVYNDGPDSDTSGCDHPGDAGCWADRHIVLAAFPPSGQLVMGAAQDPNGDSQNFDKGGPSMAVVVADAGARPGPLTFSWTQARATVRGALLTPLPTAPLGVSATGIPDPAHTEPANPDYENSCATSGLDDSSGCLAATLAAVNEARAAEGVKAMVLPPGFAQMTTADQLFVTTNLERVDRGLPPFVGLSAALDANAAKGANTANDPPEPSNVIGDDEEWSGGAANGLDADYGWMYDDGRGSANADCPRSGGAGCWGHRHGILDNLGPVGTLVMGAAYNPTGDTAAQGWAGGTSMATTLAAQLVPPKSYGITWAQVDG